MLDRQILMEPHGGGILSVLSEMSIQYTIQEQIVPLSISWVCESKSHSFDNEMKVMSKQNIFTFSLNVLCYSHS